MVRWRTRGGEGFSLLTHHHPPRHYYYSTACSKYSLHALPVVSSAEGEQDVVMGVVTDVEVRWRGWVVRACMCAVGCHM